MSSPVQTQTKELKRDHGGGLATPSTSKPSRSHRRNRERTPSWFYDNLSRIWLVPRALRELDRRFPPPKPPPPPVPATPSTPLRESEELKRFARSGGPDLQDLRGYPIPSNTDMDVQRGSSSSSQRRSASQRHGTSSTSRTSAYDLLFKQHLTDHGYIVDAAREPPGNLMEIRQSLKIPRRSLSPSSDFDEQDFAAFCIENERCEGEASAMRKLLPTILGTDKIPSGTEVLFNSLDPLTDGSLVTPKVDLYDGCNPNDVNSDIRKVFGSVIEPTKDKSRPCLPNFFLEAKGPNGTGRVATNQIMYHSFIGARGIHALRQYVYGDQALDCNAYTLSVTFLAGTGQGVLNLYSTHPVCTDPETNTIEWRMILLNAWSIVGSSEGFHAGITALRNARTWAHQQRLELANAANLKLQQEGLASLEPITPAVNDSQSTITPDSPEHEDRDGNKSDSSPDPLTGPSTSFPSFGSETSRERSKSRRRASKPKSSTPKEAQQRSKIRKSK